MFNLFKNTFKKYKPLSEYEEDWLIAKRDKEGLIIRINTGYKEAVGHPDYPISMGITIPVKNMDDESVAILKWSVEDTIMDILEDGEKGNLVAVITGLNDPKFIEFLSYTKNNLDFETINKTIQDKFQNQEVQMYAKADPNWETYQSFLN